MTHSSARTSILIHFRYLLQVLDHAGKPPIADGDLADGERQMCLPAAHP